MSCLSRQFCHSMENIWAIILAAGESKRMGTSKMLLPVNGSTMLGCSINNILSSGINDVMVVVSPESEKIISEIEKFSVNFCINARFREGMLSSVICGLDNLPAEHGSLLIHPGDQPLVRPETIRRLLETKDKSRFGIIVPFCCGKRGHPVIIDEKYSDYIRQLDTGKGLRSLLFKYPEDVIEVETDDSGVLKDFNTYDQYIREINQK